MKKSLIQIGKIYFGGSGGRYETRRKVLEMGVRVRHQDGKNTESDTGVKFLQVKGPYTGTENVIPLISFAQWAKGEFQE
jgi:hypothetical protein